MVHSYQGHYTYDATVIRRWDSTAIGVYYCGYINSTDGLLYPHYIGKGTGEEGMRGRLLSHLREEYWPDVVHFGLCFCDTAAEADTFEIQEIKRCQPKYNTQHI